MDDRVALMDQGSFLGLRALGRQPCFLATWTYERQVDLAQLRRWNDALAQTLLGRLIEPSPLPGGRHRWVAIDHSPHVEVEAASRPRAEVAAWTDELARRTTDPEHGPGWRIGVLHLTDGGSAVALLLPHTLGDGLCALEAIADAVEGRARRPGYPSRGERPRRSILWDDFTQFIHDLRLLPKAVAAGARVARAQVAATDQPTDRRPRARTAIRSRTGDRSGRGILKVPAACVRTSQADWDAAAERLGGTSNTMVQAVAAKLGERLDRVGQDGRVTLALPVSVRGRGDTRANALESATIRIDPRPLPADLRPLRQATKTALINAAERSGDINAALPLVGLTPRFVARRTEALAMGASALPIGCSNYGDLPEAVPRIDGAPCDDFWVRLVEPGITAPELDSVGGQLYLLSGRTMGAVFLSAIARPVGGGLSDEELHRHLIATLAEYGVKARCTQAAPSF